MSLSFSIRTHTTHTSIVSQHKKKSFQFILNFTHIHIHLSHTFYSNIIYDLRSRCCTLLQLAHFNTNLLMCAALMLIRKTLQQQSSRKYRFVALPLLGAQFSTTHTTQHPPVAIQRSALVLRARSHIGFYLCIYFMRCTLVQSTFRRLFDSVENQPARPSDMLNVI